MPKELVQDTEEEEILVEKHPKDNVNL